jgi:hypothetical protein
VARRRENKSKVRRVKYPFIRNLQVYGRLFPVLISSSVIAMHLLLFIRVVCMFALTVFMSLALEQRGIFGLPLITSIEYANVAISLFNDKGEPYIYGYVPIVVAKCGVFLKEKGVNSAPYYNRARLTFVFKPPMLKVYFD